MMNTRQITTAIPYMNGILHIGHALEFLLTDSIARYNTLSGHDTYFLTGSDEHGSKIYNAAKNTNQEVIDMLDTNVSACKNLIEKLNVENTDFIRTTDKKDHWPVAQAIWKKIDKSGDFYKKEFSGYYSERHERFATDKDLDENNNLLEDGSPTVYITDTNYFFRLSKYETKIRELIEKDIVHITPEFRKNEMLAFLDGGLEDISFSRSKKQMSWGIPVPGDEEQIMYVWCDALTNYFSGLRYDTPEKLFENIFSPYVHVIGKDIARFHCIYWIAMLLSADLPLPKNILIHGFINDASGNKMSKSVGNVVDPHDILKQIGADGLRFYLLSEAGPGRDIHFSHERIHDIYNDQLVNNYGNFVNRAITLYNKYTPKGVVESCELIQQSYEKYTAAMERFDTREAIRITMNLLDNINKYLNIEEPWKQTDETKRDKVLLMMTEYLYHITILLSPFLPETTTKVLTCLGISERKLLPNTLYTSTIDTIQKPELLFEKKTYIEQTKEIHCNITISPKISTPLAVLEFSLEKNNKKQSKPLQKFLKEQYTQLDLEDATRQDILEGYKKSLKKLGLDNQICASKNLENIYQKSGKLPNISKIVDIYNIVSLKTGLSFGVHDMANLPENIEITYAKGGEDFSPMLGAKLPDIQAGEIIVQGDNGRAYGRDIKQSEESKITEATTHALLYIQGNTTTSQEQIDTALEQVTSYLQQFADITIQS